MGIDASDTSFNDDSIIYEGLFASANGLRWISARDKGATVLQSYIDWIMSGAGHHAPPACRYSEIRQVNLFY